MYNSYFCTVKKLMAYSFLLLFLTINTPLGQILRFPTLFHHYLEHVEWDNSSWSEFFNEHYAMSIHHPDDSHHDHEKLPFKSDDSRAIQIVKIASEPIFSLSGIILYKSEITLSIPEHQHYSNAFLNSIWHPPQFS